jgi:Ca2+-transporting ATPase
MLDKQRLDAEDNEEEPTVSVSQDLSEQPVEQVLKTFDSSLREGLDSDTAARLLEKHGPNEIAFKQTEGSWRLFFRQFQSSVVILLMVAAGVSFSTNDTLQALGILAAVVINAAVGFATEMKAQLSLAALRQMSTAIARVVRSAHHALIPASELVPGDIVILEPGSRIPADLRFVEAAALKVDESILTGESVPVEKSAEYIDGESKTSTLGFHGTHVLTGRARGVVISTGKDTSLGKLQCSLLAGHAVPTPLEVKLEELGKQLSVITVVVCVVIGIAGLIKQIDVWSMLETSIALAVAAIPEGLPVVATLALAIGTQRMVKAGVLIRQLSAVETLGCTTVICTDKTGTLTENKLLVTDIFIEGRKLKVSGIGYNPDGDITECGARVEGDKLLKLLLKATSLCNDARLEQNLSENSWNIAGDPTEGALLTAAAKAGLDHKILRSTYPRIDELPFDLVRKKMATLHRAGDSSNEAYIKGSPEKIIADSTFLYQSDGIVSFTNELKAEYLRMNESYAKQGLRVLGVAMKELDVSDNKVEMEKELTFLGLVGMRDLPRQGVGDAIAECKQAGIRVLMLTGDQPDTAERIGLDLGIGSGSESTMTGQQFAHLEKQAVSEALMKTCILARVTPDVKLDVVRALQSRGEVVAMTGDGVNDAPALQQANIGVAMGLSGTDLAKEASNMVITDDNFSTIVNAIEQGRIIYDNIRKAICYLLTASVASVITIAIVLISTGLLALNPLQLLWLNLIMHVFPGLGIVLQTAAPGTMQRPPRNPTEKLLGNFELTEIIIRAIVVSLAVLCAIAYFHSAPSGVASTAAFATMSIALLYQAWNWLFITSDLKKRKAAPVNNFMHAMMVVSYLLVLIAVYAPPLQDVLKTVSLSVSELGIVIAISTVSIVVSILLERIHCLLLHGKNKRRTEEVCTDVKN